MTIIKFSGRKPGLRAPPLGFEKRRSYWNLGAKHIRVDHNTVCQCSCRNGSSELLLFSGNFDYPCELYFKKYLKSFKVNINPSYQSEELRYAIEKVGIRALITPPGFKKSNYYQSIKVGV